MNLRNVIFRLKAMNAPTEGTPAATPSTPTSTQVTESAPAESLLGNGAAPPAPTESEGDSGQVAPVAAVPLTREDLSLGENFSDFVVERIGEGADAKDVTALDKAIEVMNDTALGPKERLQKLVDLQTSMMQQAAEQSESAWTQMQNQWKQEVEALPEIGGAKLPETLAVTKKVLDAHGADKEFYAAMDLTGAGNNPHIIRVLHSLAKNLSEGKPVLGEPPKGKLPPEARLYPTMFKQE